MTKKGPKHEVDVVGWLRSNGWPHARRLVKEGVNDKGDVALGDGIPVTVECKNEAKLDLAAGQRELEAEMTNNGHTWGFTVHKRRGTTDVGRYYAVLPVEILMDILDNVAAWPHQEQRRRQVRRYFGRPDARKELSPLTRTRVVRRSPS